MSQPQSSGTGLRLTPTQWLICVIAAIGFAFDIYEILVFPLALRPALETMGHLEFGSAAYKNWASLLFYMPAVFGGIFGLLGGYLTDRFGRRQVLTWSILIYALSAVGAGFATSLQMLLFFRTTTFIGVCVEFVAAVAWLAELFSDPKQREKVLGFTQAFSSAGGMMVTGMWALINQIGHNLPAIHGEHALWRYALISGVIPAIPLIIIRPFLPESPAWQEKKAAGTLRRPSIGELFQPAFLRTTIVTTVMMACAYGAAFGAIQHLPQIVPGIPTVQKAMGNAFSAEVPGLEAIPMPQRREVIRGILQAAAKPKEERIATIQAIPAFAALTPDQKKAIVKDLPKGGEAARRVREEYVSSVQAFQETGGLVGRFILAFLAVIIVSRRVLIRIFQVPGLILLPVVFFLFAKQDVRMLQWGIFFCGLTTVAQLSFWGNYLPRVYPIHLRGTGESFAANIGGRMLGTSAFLLTTQLSTGMPDKVAGAQLATAAALVGFTVYLIGLIASFWLPEPKQEELPE